MLGAPALGVLLFGLLVLANDVVQHANIALPEGIDRGLRRVVVTPDMHRVHHSMIRRETDSNYGVIFPWWDRLLRTYREQPVEGHSGMGIGLTEFRHPRHGNALWMLAVPFLPGDRAPT
jgi:sterol desaturase/sphingolipid hydroxylase (fatty acid hydroxylase superfamily)